MIFVGLYAGDHIHKLWYPGSDDDRPIAGSTAGNPRGPTPDTDGGDEAVFSFRYNG